MISSCYSERVGRSAGASFRIAKGFWIRTGGSEGYSVQRSSMDHQGDGMLILTNKAIAFIGAASTRIPFTKILAFEAFTDGFSLHTDCARNNKHMFGNVHPQNMIFLRSALGLMTGREESLRRTQMTIGTGLRLKSTRRLLTEPKKDLPRLLESWSARRWS
jgi:hypothetical protein